MLIFALIFAKCVEFYPKSLLSLLNFPQNRHHSQRIPALIRHIPHSEQYPKHSQAGQVPLRYSRCEECVFLHCLELTELLDELSVRVCVVVDRGEGLRDALLGHAVEGNAVVSGLQLGVAEVGRGRGSEGWMTLNHFTAELVDESSIIILWLNPQQLIILLRWYWWRCLGVLNWHLYMRYCSQSVRKRPSYHLLFTILRLLTINIRQSGRTERN